MMMSGLLYDPAALLPGKEPPPPRVTLELEDEWALFQSELSRV
jgi:hypothetical protein